MQSAPQESSAQQDNAPTSSIDLESIWRGKWYLVVSVCFFLLLGAVYVYTADPMHQIGTRLLVQQQGPPLEYERYATGDRDFLATQAEIIRSPAVIQRAVDSLALPQDPESEINPVVSILENLTVDPLIGTNVLSVRFRDTDVSRGIRTVESIIASYRTYLQTSERDAHRETLQLLSQRERELRDELKSLQDRYHQSREESPLLGQGNEAASVQRAMLTDLGQALIVTKNRRLELENNLQSLVWSDQAEAMENTSLRTVPDSIALAMSPFTGGFVASTTTDNADVPEPVIEGDLKGALNVLSRLSEESWAGIVKPDQIQQALMEARSRETELSQRYGPKHPEILAVRQQIAALNAQLRELAQSAPAALERELDSVRRQEHSLTELYNHDIEQSKELDMYLMKEQQSLDEIQRLQALYDTILGQFKQWQMFDRAVADGRLGVIVRVLESPALGERQIVAPPKLIVAFCGVFGLLGGIVLIAATQRLRSKTCIRET